VLIILLIAAVVYAVLLKLWGRTGPAVRDRWQQDPRFRAAATGFGLLALRAFMSRILPGAGRWLSLMRWFR
jgi:hypothetical protein